VPKFVEVAAELTYESADGTTLTVDEAEALAPLKATTVTNVTLEATPSRSETRPIPRCRASAMSEDSELPVRARHSSARVDGVQAYAAADPPDITEQTAP
jgi:hypothetical protein